MSLEPQANPQEYRQAGAPIIGNCLACHGLVKVPVTASANDDVRCPHCQQTFSLSKLLNQVVPELEVVSGSDDIHLTDADAPAEDTQLPSVDQFVVPSQLAKGAFRRKKKRRKSNTSEVTAADSPSADTSPESLVVDTGREDKQTRDESNRRSKGRRKSRKSKRTRGFNEAANPIVEAVKVGLGAALAIPIAYLIVLWGFKQDPLNVAPTLGSAIPGLIPATFREEDGKEEDPSPSQSKSDRNKEDSNPIEDPIPSLDSNAGFPSERGLDGASGRLAVPKIDPAMLQRNN